MEQSLQILTNINILGGVGFALFAVLLGTKLKDIGLRDYILVLTFALLGTAGIIERWFLSSSFITSCLVGFAIGFIADDVYLNLRATLPEVIKTLLIDLLQTMKDKLLYFIGKDK